MSTVSYLVQQHIGEVERKVSKALKGPQALLLQSIGCEFQDGIRLYDTQTGFIYEPYCVVGNITTLRTPPEIKRAATVFEAYGKYLEGLGVDTVRNALELQSRREELHDLRVKEQLRMGGRLWLYSSVFGVSQIHVISASDTKIRYKLIVNGVIQDEVIQSYVNRISFFLSEEEACEHRKACNFRNKRVGEGTQDGE